METNQQPKRKYKKHIDGFKVAVEYKLNTKLKGLEAIDGQNLYPVYIEVRVKRKRHYFPSYHMFYVLPEEFDEFKACELVRVLFEDESDLIKRFVREHYNDPANENNHKWYNSYKQISANGFTYHRLRWVIEHKLEFEYTGEVFEKNKIIDALLFSKGEYVQNTLDLLISLKTENSNQMTQELIYVLRTYLRIKEFLSFYSREWFSPQLRVVFYLEHSISLPILLNNTFIKNKINSIGYQPDMFYLDLNSLKKFMDSIDNV